MNCCKYTIKNTSNTIANVNFKKCDDKVWYYEFSVKPNEIKEIWLEQYSYSTEFKSIKTLSTDCSYTDTIPSPTHSGTPPATPTQTVTPTHTTTPTYTPTHTTTPSVTPTFTPTPSTTFPYSSTFCVGQGFDSEVDSISLQPDGKILVGGSFNHYNGTSAYYIIRLNSDGSIDNTFNSGIGFDDFTYLIVLQPDGKILAVGNFNNYNNVSANHIIRLNSNGTIDNTFNYGFGFDYAVYTVVLQPDGKILVGGNFSNYNGNTANYFTRLNSDGTIDNSLNSGIGFNGEVYTITVQPDGKILVGGYFNHYNGVSVNSLIRLNSDGTIDNTYNSGNFSLFTNIYTTTLQLDGKILVGGEFTSYSGVPASNIIRLNSNGTIDNTFNYGSGFDSYVLTITVQSFGKILVGGGFNSYNVNSVNYIIRLNPNGTIDNTFNSGEGFDGIVVTTLEQPNGDILVGGNFQYYNYSYYPTLVKIKNNGDLITCNNPIIIPTTPFIGTWKTTSPNETIEIPLQPGGNCYCTIDWGDGNTDLITYWNQPEKQHQYSLAGTYTVKISGLTSNFAFDGGSYASKIYSVEQFGGIKLGYSGAFKGCTNLNLTGVTDTPNLINRQYNFALNFTFFGCSSLTSINNFNSWITSGITEMYQMFIYATSFNQNINNLDVSNVRYMNGMFLGATSFDNPLSGWIVSNVIDMTDMFHSATAFNQSLNNWDVKNVTNMNYMFADATSFNQPLSGWNVSSISGSYGMEGMFKNASSFNQDLSHWCVTNISSLPFQFYVGAASWVGLPGTAPQWGTCPP